MNALSRFVPGPRSGLLIVACALACVVPSPTISAAATDRAESSAIEQPQALPVSVWFEKAVPEDSETPMILRLKNEARESMSVGATIETSIVVPNRPKSRTVPPQVVPPGGTLSIDKLAPDDRVTLTAEGFDPLLVIVPDKP